MLLFFKIEISSSDGQPTLVIKLELSITSLEELKILTPFSLNISSEIPK